MNAKSVLLAILLTLNLATPVLASETSKISFWDNQRKGTNFFNLVETRERFKAARQFGVQVVRLAPNKWLNGRDSAELGDFIIGRPGQFKTVNAKDVALLKQVLDDAEAEGIKVVITMLSLPGNRWTQHNNGVEERVIWESFEEQNAAIDCWRQMARSLKDHPAVVGYNVRNEPSPELLKPRFKDWFTEDYQAWYKTIKGTPRDLNDFYKRAVAAIREVDKDTPIVLDSGFYATAWAFKILEPIADDKVIYSFHMYEPGEYTSYKNRKKYEYPGTVPTGDGDEPPLVKWDKDEIFKYFQPVRDWQAKNNVRSNRIYVGEFGVYRSSIGARQYLSDLIEAFNKAGWHWSFYSFREDNWDGMDYELGAGEPDDQYRKAIKENRMPVYKPNPISGVLKDAMK